MDLALEYDEVVRRLDRPIDPVLLGRALLSSAASRYEGAVRECALYEFEQSGATFLFDLASAVGAVQDDRTVAAWALTAGTVNPRDTAYQRGFPMVLDPNGFAVDRGHIIPHLSGGEFGPNIFRQDRALNRGWSEEGKRFRSLEREAAGMPGSFYFGLYGARTRYRAADQALRSGDGPGRIVGRDVPTAVFDPRQGLRLVGVAGPIVGFEGRGDPGAAP